MNTSEDKHGGFLLAEAVRKAYARGQTDYSMEPLVRLNPDGQPFAKVQDGDAVIFCCRRGEREIELTEAFTETDFAHFERTRLQDLEFVILTLYHDKFKDLPVAFAPAKLDHTLGELLSKAGKTQMRCSESEKFAHVTFFLNGGNNQPYPGEVDVRVPSPKGIPFDQVPELSLPAVADEVIRGLREGIDCIVTNFANGDVIGHTSNSEAKIACAQAVDEHLARVLQVAKSGGYVSLITADHGNLEVLLTAEGKPHVAHTSNLVPFIVIDPQAKADIQLSDGSLRDLTPTILDILGVETHPSMTGAALVKPHHWGKDRKVLLIILDGWGEGSQDENNPIFVATTPTWDALCRDFPLAHLQASGEAVGLQAGKPGNSEAGHMNIGAGRTVLQDDVRLDLALKDGSFAKNEVFVEAIENVLRKGSNLHLIGLLTEKSSHGSIDYPLALLRMAKEKGISNAFLHLIFDGRSTEPGSAPALLEKLEGELRKIGLGTIVTAVGRGIALDRDGNYGKIKKAYEAMVLGQGTPW
jgi:2,3-bisphosphoglycerate-independent phosphoglycerate mutase